MKIAVCFIIFFFARLIFASKTNYPFTLNALSLECFNVNTKYVQLDKCQLDVLDKGKRKLINLQGHLKQAMQDFYAHIRVYYKAGNGKFLPHIINLDLDACKAAIVYDSTNPVIGRFGAFFERYLPDLRRGCPYKGSFVVKDFDFAQEGPEFFPPTVAPGTYMIHTRVHTGNGNKTLLEEKFVFEIKIGSVLGMFTPRN